MGLAFGGQVAQNLPMPLPRTQDGDRGCLQPSIGMSTARAVSGEFSAANKDLCGEKSCCQWPALKLRAYPSVI
jgi:hypothetical protein